MLLSPAKMGSLRTGIFVRTSSIQQLCPSSRFRIFRATQSNHATFSAVRSEIIAYLSLPVRILSERSEKGGRLSDKRLHCQDRDPGVFRAP
jgi:hypothetical protein